MTHFTPGLILEALLVVLLLTTVCYCVVLNARLGRLRASQQELRQIVSDLTQATTHAETAIRGLRTTTQEAEAALADKLHKAQLLTRELSTYSTAGSSLRSAAIAAVTPAFSPRPVSLDGAPADAAPAAPAPRPEAAAPGAPAVDREAWRRHALSRLKRAS
jgi:hypothetical protein